MFLEPDRATAPVPPELREFGVESTNADMASTTTVIPARIDEGALDELRARADVVVWPNSELQLYADWDPALRDVQAEPRDTVGVLDAPSAAPSGVDCRPFRPAVDIGTIQALLDVSAIWDEGYRGQGVIVGIIDEGVDGTAYPVVGGFARPGSQAPGSAGITSHGSMCAADVLIAAPEAKLYDYPFLGIPTSGGALQMFQAVLDQRRIDGTPHLTSNSYGFVGIPPKAQFPTHEVWDVSHPIHRKVREVDRLRGSDVFRSGQLRAELPERRLPRQRDRTGQVDPRVEQHRRGHHDRRGEQHPPADRVLVAGTGDVRAAEAGPGRVLAHLRQLRSGPSGR